MKERLILHGGTVYDPANNIDGVVKDLYVEEGKMVAPWPATESARKLDVSGMVVMSGGVDIHSHIAGPVVNRARRLLPEQIQADLAPGTKNDWVSGLVASTCLTGCRYSALGYTFAVEAAIAASGARQAHFELAATPNLDKAMLLLLGNHEQVLEVLAHRDKNQLHDLVAALLHKTGAFGMKIVNPGYVADWQRHGGDPKAIGSLDEKIGGTSLTPRDILLSLADVAESLQLPHAIHVHPNQLGIPGNIAITLDTLRALQGRRHHLTHIQFHAYGQANGNFTSAAAALMDYINQHPETTCDIGQVMFGPVLTVTEDSPLEYLLWQLTGARWVNLDTELESGCGMLPFEFKDTMTLHAWQWAIGLELLLLAADPWRVALSTDHPNGASFLSYPRIIATLMDAEFRRTEWKRLPAAVREKTLLRELRREYTLSEIAIITRAGPARILGLPHKGHLGPEADADITVYSPQADKQAMFVSPRLVLKGGSLLVEEGQLRASSPGTTLGCSVPIEREGDQLLRKWFEEKGSYAYEQFGISPLHVHQLMRVGVPPGIPRR